MANINLIISKDTALKLIKVLDEALQIGLPEGLEGPKDEYLIQNIIRRLGSELGLEINFKMDRKQCYGKKL